MTDDELRKKLKELEIDPFEIDYIMKFCPTVFKIILRKRKEVNHGKTISKH